MSEIDPKLAQLNADIATTLKYLRTHVGEMSQTQLAKRLNVVQSRVSQLENPQHNGYNVSQLWEIADIFDVDVKVVFYKRESDES